MQNPTNVLSQAFDGLVNEVSLELGISDKRIYQMLAVNNPYTKTWRLLNPLGRLNTERLTLVKADFNARCDRILKPAQSPSTIATVHQQVAEAIQSILEKHDRAMRKRQILEAIAELQKELEKCED